MGKKYLLDEKKNQGCFSHKNHHETRETVEEGIHRQKLTGLTKMFPLPQ